MRAPLASVEVVLRRAADSTVVAHAGTGPDGRFRFGDLRQERYLLRASLLGHESFVRRDLVLSDGAPDVDLGTIALAVAAIAIPGATVNEARATAILSPDRNAYLTKDMPSATGGTATEVLRAVPELDVDINGNVSLRGSSSVTIQFNGRAAPLKGEALTTFLRQMPASRIERVEVIANPSARFDPEGTAGIVNIVLKDGAGLGLSGSVNGYVGRRYNGAGARIAWQEGKLTFFGGLSGSLYQYDYGSSTERFGLLSTPPSLVRYDAESGYRGRYAMSDASVDYALTPKVTIYGTLNGSRGANDTESSTRYTLADSTPVVSGRYDRTDDGERSNNTTSVTAGLQHVAQQGKDERDIEFMQSRTSGDNETRGRTITYLPTDSPERTSRNSTATGYCERAIQANDTRPLGAKGKLELGYRGSERIHTNSGALRVLEGGVPAVPSLDDDNDYRHREVFHSGYATLGSTFGRFSVQAGARAEAARTTFEVRSTGQSFENDYRSLFPSANVAWDFGKGRSVRATYSKRIERPSAWYLNPDVPFTDSLNRTVGNPDLGPKYTHSYSLDASWNGSRGSLRLSPYLRHTIGNWDWVTTVNPDGRATATWRNASSVRVFGASLTGSLRQTGRWGGTASVGLSREHHDAGNLSEEFRRDATSWSASGNLTFKATGTLDLQMYLRYTPPSILAQGRTSSYTFLQLGTRQKLGEKGWLSLSFNDPFQWGRYWNRTGDSSYSQTSTHQNRMRTLSGSFTWTWGKAPEQKQRRQTAEQPQGDSPTPGR
ncbi:MAG: TonB-dependent receptor [Candidatus Eisenbacteria bacterium]|nr:TonB-dependent receptor [Candidatus Eisenbacteria bacterium]